MNAIITLLVVCCCIAVQGQDLPSGESYSHTDGRPLCIPEELGIKWRNNFDNVRYWVCSGNGAVSYICPIEYLFSFERQCCIRWNFWVWSPPFDPPSYSA